MRLIQTQSGEFVAIPAITRLMATDYGGGARVVLFRDTFRTPDIGEEDCIVFGRYGDDLDCARKSLCWLSGAIARNEMSIVNESDYRQAEGLL